MIIILRVLFIFITICFSFINYFDVSLKAAILSVVISAVIALLFIIAIEYVSHTSSSRNLLAAIIGLLFGLILSHLIVTGFSYLPLPLTASQIANVKAVIYYLTSFAIMMFFVINHENMIFLNKILPLKVEDNIMSEGSYKILDTSVIIDGRIADICDTGFIDGILVIPNFVLNELQMIADSSDPIKRTRGRRGLDILNKMQKDQITMVKMTDMDFPEINEVDAKLVKLGSVMNAKLVTNDFNLNKVAEFQGVPVLNINLLSNALKPVVLPGEEMRVALVKEGKDQSQAIGYLDDGTMIVVENGRKKLNQEVDLTVTSVLQTTAGRMIFAKLKNG